MLGEKEREEREKTKQPINKSYRGGLGTNHLVGGLQGKCKLSHKRK